MKHDLAEVVRHFQLEGKFLDAAPIGSGHINDTYVSRFQEGPGEVYYVHQWINTYVFREPDKLMENIERVTRHAWEQISAAGGDPRRETLTLVPTTAGKSFYRSPEGECWRTYLFIEDAHTFDRAEDPRLLYAVGKAFGDFQRMLSTLPGERLHETIPNFHHTPRRFAAFLQAIEKDAHNRVQSAKAEIGFVQQREAQTSVIVDLLARGAIPERVTHNDTKINNVLIDDRTGAGICVIDLDTVMPGSALYDFGDAVRLGASTAAEDERDLDKVGLDLDLFDRLAAGYLDAAACFLTPTEMDYLAFSAILITLELGMRFLTDHLNGDVYFKIHRENHNLDRCRTQFKMVAEMERQLDRMNAIVNRYRGGER
jgi:Ser/Thr protein kinase RdoA (MazF antagonist)